MAYKYNPGDAVGEHGVILVKRLPREGTERDPKMLFRCPQCGELFKDQLCHVSTGRKKVCNKCADQRTYFEGEKYGPVNTLMIKRIPGGKDIWKCSYCGKLFETRREDIRTGDTRSCGCYKSKSSSERFTLDLAGQKFGRLTAIKIDEAKSREWRKQTGKQQHIWLCKCECGNEEVYVSTSNLTRGDTQSCGCLQRDRAKEANLKDIAGQRFGMLTVIERCNDQTICGEDKKKRNYWRCLCDCGNEAYYTTNQLTSMRKRNCGCERITSYGEELVKEILTDGGIPFKFQWSPKDCINHETGGRLIFDFKIVNKNICIEFDGKQHFSEEDSIYANNSDIHKRDMIKNAYCEENDIYLIRIPYTYYKTLIKKPDLLFDWLTGKSQPVLPDYNFTE